MTQTKLATTTSQMGKWKSYPAYKASGIEWLGEIPVHWDLAPLYSRYSIQLGKMRNQDHITGLALAPYLRNVNIQWDYVDISDIFEMDFDLAERRKYALSYGDLLVCEGGEVGRTAIWRGELAECYIQNAVHRVRPLTPREEGRFLYYALCAEANLGVFKAEVNRSTIGHLTSEKLKKYRFLFPPLKEQRAITTFLDHETGRINSLIAKKERLIELLQEKRAALISQAIIKGLDPTAPMKDSGVEWLGEIPAHWEVKRIKHLTRIISKGTTPTTIGKEFWDEGIRFIKAENITNSRVISEPATFIDAATNELLQRSMLHMNDILMVIAGATTGKVGIINDDQLPANTNQAVAFIRLRDQSNAHFFLYWLGSLKIQEQVWLMAVQAAQPNLSLEDIGNFVTPVPPTDEVINIIKYLDHETTKIDALISRIREGIEKLREYRTALISAAVTGKIDVREGR